MILVERSSGGVIFNDDEYLLLKYGWGHWGFVKGKIEKDETYTDTFLREAEEETGLTPDELRIIDGFKESISYFYKKHGNTIYKEVFYLLAESSSKDISLSYEHDDYLWLPFEKAADQLTHENARNILKKAHEFFKK